MFQEFLSHNKEYFNFWGFLIAFCSVILSIDNGSQSLNVLKILASLILLVSVCILSIKLLAFFSEIDKKMLKDKENPLDINLASTFAIFFVFFFFYFFKFLKESYANELSIVFSIIAFCIVPIMIPIFLHIVKKIKIKANNNFSVFIKNLIFPSLLMSGVTALITPEYSNFNKIFFDKVIEWFKNIDFSWILLLLVLFLLFIFTGVAYFFYYQFKDKKNKKISC